MSSSTLYSLTREDIPKAVESLKDAFSNDPLWKEVFEEDPDQGQAGPWPFGPCPWFPVCFSKVIRLAQARYGLLKCCRPQQRHRSFHHADRLLRRGHANLRLQAAGQAPLTHYQ